jgi:hypothetical protein
LDNNLPLNLGLSFAINFHTSKQINTLQMYNSLTLPARFLCMQYSKLAVYFYILCLCVLFFNDSF